LALDRKSNLVADRLDKRNLADTVLLEKVCKTADKVIGSDGQGL